MPAKKGIFLVFMKPLFCHFPDVLHVAQQYDAYKNCCLWSALLNKTNYIVTRRCKDFLLKETELFLDFGKRDVRMCRFQASNFTHFVIFDGIFWPQRLLKHFLGMLRQWYGYVKHCARSYIFSALWIRLIRRFNPTLSYKTWQTHGFLADLSLSVSPPFWRGSYVCSQFINICI